MPLRIRQIASRCVTNEIIRILLPHPVHVNGLTSYMRAMSFAQLEPLRDPAYPVLAILSINKFSFFSASSRLSVSAFIIFKLQGD